MDELNYSIIIPVYKNEENIPRLLLALREMHISLSEQTEIVFVVDGSPDRSFEILKNELNGLPMPVQLIAHSRNFGSFPAIRTGLAAARGAFFGVMAADLQEPPELIIQFFKSLAAGECDVTIGTRSGRNDPLLSKFSSSLFWGLYRKLVVHDMPEGGVDIFGCNKIFRDHLLVLEESRSSLIALIFWLGFKRKYISYTRQLRQEGKSSWTLSKKIDYMLDSVFAFTDYPIRLLLKIGAIGLALSIILAGVVVIGKLTGTIDVPGYAATMLTVLFFGAVNLFGLGLVGTYAVSFSTVIPLQRIEDFLGRVAGDFLNINAIELKDRLMGTDLPIPHRPNRYGRF
jgi:glycosyltransferase involved in cell wall biosynthesis